MWILNPYWREKKREKKGKQTDEKQPTFYTTYTIFGFGMNITIGFS